MESEQLVRIIRTSTEEVFSMMLGIPIETGAPRIEPQGDQSFDGVVAIVGLAGSFVGAGRISCSAPFACTISGALLATEFSSVNEDVLDAIAEVTNMIIGNVKSQIENEYGPMGLSIPTVIFGRNYRARNSGATDWVMLPFESGGERLEVRVGLVAASQEAPQRADLVVHQVL